MYSDEADMTFSSCVFTGNTAFSGGAINANGPLTLSECTLTGNFAGESGGGVFSNAALVVRDSTVLGNTAPAGADISYRLTLTLSDSVVGDVYHSV
jgi:predicted outer membrane repeat protein